MHTITAVRCDSNGRIMEVKLENGNILSVSSAIQLAARNELDGFMMGADKNGLPTLKGVADGNRFNNLSNLPRF